MIRRLLRFFRAPPMPRATKADVLRCIYRPAAMAAVGVRYRDKAYYPDVTILLELMVASHLAVDPDGMMSETGRGLAAARDVLQQWKAQEAA